MTETDPNTPWADAREQIMGQAMLTGVEAEILGEDPHPYAADVSDLALLTTALGAWATCRDSVVGRRALADTGARDDVAEADTFTEADADDMLNNYRFAWSEVRRVVVSLAERWATEEEEDMFPDDEGDDR